jgi:hypothetical protein
MAQEVCTARSLFASTPPVESTMSADTMHVDDSLLSSIEDANMRVFMALIAQRNSRCLSTTATLDIASIMIDIAVKNGESCTIARNGGWLKLSDGLITLPFTRYSCTPSFGCYR